MKNPRPLHVDGFHGAHLVAAKAADAALWRDVRLFVFHRDGVARADLGALAAADAFASVDLRARGQPFFHAGHGPTQRARRFVGKADIRKARGQLVIRHGRGSLRIAAQQRLVQRRLAQAAGVGGGKEALALLGRKTFDVVILDVMMPGMDGIETLREMKKKKPLMEVIMLTGHGTVDLCRRAFKAGAAEFLEKPVDDELLLDTLQQSVRRHVQCRQRYRADRLAHERYQQLSEREQEVLGLIIAGLTNKEIGRALAVSHRTVETHRANLFAKLQAESLAQLIRQYATLDEADDSTTP